MNAASTDAGPGGGSAWKVNQSKIAQAPTSFKPNGRTLLRLLAILLAFPAAIFWRAAWWQTRIQSQLDNLEAGR